MRYWMLFLVLAVGLTSACGPAPTPLPTPLPTAVPPDPDRAQDVGTWAISFQYEFPADTFGPGPHRYSILAHCPLVSAEDMTSGWHFFEISEQVPKQAEPLYLRMHGLSAEPFNPSAIANTTIHPQRPITAIVHLVGLPLRAAEMAADGCEAIVFWDEVGRHPMTPGEPFQP